MKFKVGDKVHVYGAGRDCSRLGKKGFFDEKFESPWTAKVEKIDCNMLEVKRVSDRGRVGDGKILTVYPQQCRLLKKKERRRVWIEAEAVVIATNPNSSIYPSSIVRDSEGLPAGPKHWIEFIEV